MYKIFIRTLIIVITLSFLNNNVSNINQPIGFLLDDSLKSKLALLVLPELKLKLFISNLIVSEKERYLVKLDTIGGYVHIQQEISKAIKNSEVPVDTQINRYAASAGAIIFLDGENRIMKKEAEIMFHGAKSSHTIPQFERALQFIKSGKFKSSLLGYYKPQTLAEVDAFNMLIDGSTIYGFYNLQNVIEDEIKSLTESNEAGLIKTLNIINKKHPEMTKEQVKEKVYANYDRDVTLTAQEAFDLGIATKIID